MSNNDNIENAIYEEMENKEIRRLQKETAEAIQKEKIRQEVIDDLVAERMGMARKNDVENSEEDEDKDETFYEKVHDITAEILMYIYFGAFTIFFITAALGLSVLIASGIIKLLQMMFI